MFHVIVQTLIRSLRKTTSQLPQAKRDTEPRHNDLTGFIVVLFVVIIAVAAVLLSNM